MDSGRNSITMADSASESDSGSVDGLNMMPPSPVSRDQLHKRIDSLQQQNRVLKVELETYRLRVKQLTEENRTLRQASVNIQAQAEQEEEFISNTLMKKIQALKKEKETLALNYEQEEECLTNDLSRKLSQLRQEKVHLEQSLQQEQECLVSKLLKKIEKLEGETQSKQQTLEQLRREKVELENTLEQEQEALVNRLWKRMEKLETEKRMLQIKLDQPVSRPSSPKSAAAARDSSTGNQSAEQLTSHIQWLRGEVARLRQQLAETEKKSDEKVAQFAQEEKHVREENLRLQRRLQLELERRETLYRHLSESESSLEIEEERQYNELSSHGHVGPLGILARSRATSSPVPTSRPISPGSLNCSRDGPLNISVAPSGARDLFSPPSPMGRCPTCGQALNMASSPPAHSGNCGLQRGLLRSSQDRFQRPAVPAAQMTTPTSSQNTESSRR